MTHGTKSAVSMEDHDQEANPLDSGRLNGKSPCMENDVVMQDSTRDNINALTVVDPKRKRVNGLEGVSGFRPNNDQGFLHINYQKNGGSAGSGCQAHREK